MIYIDPPYQAGLYQNVLEKIAAGNLLKKEGLILTETPREMEVLLDKVPFPDVAEIIEEQQRERQAWEEAAKRKAEADAAKEGKEDFEAEDEEELDLHDEFDEELDEDFVEGEDEEDFAEEDSDKE